MTDWRQKTIDTYNDSAQELAEYFKGIGSRVEDIERGLELVGNPQAPTVIEIGCGDGRDAAEIVRRTANYTGFDVSEALIRIAKDHVPGAHFEVADASTFEYQPGIDIVFAFASLLHLSREEVKQILANVHTSLKPGGIFYISLKYKPNYTQEIKKDQYGERLFYFYSPELIAELAGKNYQQVYTDRQTIGHTEWFTIALKKA